MKDICTLRPELYSEFSYTPYDHGGLAFRANFRNMRCDMGTFPDWGDQGPGTGEYLLVNFMHTVRMYLDHTNIVCI